MSTPAEHYQNAETWINAASHAPEYMDDVEADRYMRQCIAIAQVHATLATATTAAYMPAAPSIVDFHGGGIAGKKT